MNIIRSIADNDHYKYYFEYQPVLFRLDFGYPTQFEYVMIIKEHTQIRTVVTIFFLDLQEIDP